MEITPARKKRLQEVGRALSETDVPLAFNDPDRAVRHLQTALNRCVILDPHTPWAEDEAQEWIFLSAKRDHEYAHVRYSSKIEMASFSRWVEKELAIFNFDRLRGFPSAAFALDIFHIIEDTRVERAWAMEYPGTLKRTRYYHLQRAQKCPVPAGADIMVIALQYAALLGDIPGSLLLSAEEFELIEKARRPVEEGSRAPTTRAVRQYAIKTMEIFKEYLLKREKEYARQIPDPKVTIPENLPQYNGLTDQPGEARDSREIPALSHAETVFPVEEQSLQTSAEGELLKDRALSTPGPGKDNQQEKGGSQSPAEQFAKFNAEEEFRQLYLGAKKELRNHSFQDGRARLIAWKADDAERLEKGIHQDIISRDLNPRDLAQYYHGDSETLTPVDLIRQKYQKQILQLSRDIQEVLLYKKTLPRRHLKKGWPDSSNLWKLYIGETAVFQKRTVEAAKPELAVMLLVDCSRSMRRNRRSELCKQSLTIAAEAMKKNRVKFAIEGFTTGTEYNTVVNIKFKSFEQTEIDSLDYYSGYRENRDGYSVRKAAQQLAKRPEKKKILLVLSDSVPNHTHVDRPEINYSFDLGQGTKDTIKAIRETLRGGVIVVGVFFGDAADIERVRPIYPNFVSCEAANLPLVLGGVLRRCLRRA